MYGLTDPSGRGSQRDKPVIYLPPNMTLWLCTRSSLLLLCCEYGPLPTCLQIFPQNVESNFQPYPCAQTLLRYLQNM